MKKILVSILVIIALLFLVSVFIDNNFSFGSEINISINRYHNGYGHQRVVRHSTTTVVRDNFRNEDDFHNGHRFYHEHRVRFHGKNHRNYQRNTVYRQEGRIYYQDDRGRKVIVVPSRNCYNGNH